MVNIHDVTVDEKDWEGDRLEAIFTRQSELMEKYHEIEKINGLLQTDVVPVGLHDRFGQARLKDFAWRTTEEVGEALDAYYQQKKDHCFEELADALHFLTEFTILAGMTPQDLLNIQNGGRRVLQDSDILSELFYWAKGDPDTTTVEDRVTIFIRNLGMACNCFKNKPWKQSHMLTDVKEFYIWVNRTWRSFFGICDAAGMNTDDITLFYFGKSEVNRFRQRSNY